MNESPFKGKTGLRRVWNALGYSFCGLRAAYAVLVAAATGFVVCAWRLGKGVPVRV